MTTLQTVAKPAASVTTGVFAAAVFASASLVFLVEPMVAKLVLPMLGGSPSVWNTSLAFFQITLLVGYFYAHALQRIRSVRLQAAIHVAVMILAGLTLPLHISSVFGPPTSEHPALWLIGVLAASLGAPFAVLSATAPLVQAWHARLVHAETGTEPYALYAASNLGSLLALLAYPVLVEPLMTLRGQTGTWSLGYWGFILLMAGLAVMALRGQVPLAPAHSVSTPQSSWRARLTWLALAAVPSSLMMGVTTHITTDVASAPFLWVIPLALYLITFIIAFSARPFLPARLALVLQAAAVAACICLLPFKTANLGAQLGVHLAAFFLTALVCHQALVARRPDPSQLTEFYLWMSLGGVVGGAFNAFLAPVIFQNVWEYPLVLVVSCLVRPGAGSVAIWRWMVLTAGLAATIAAPLLTVHGAMSPPTAAALVIAALCAFTLRGRTWMFTIMIVALCLSSFKVSSRVDVRETSRSFFGVLRQSELIQPPLGGRVKMLAHGTTLHGAQAVDPRWRCRPLVYYAPETPIGQVFTAMRALKPAIRVGAVGLGTGAVAAYVRPADRLTFFEIDPLVVRIASDPVHFSYTTQCAKGPIDYVVGDARLSLARQPRGAFDILLIDAFSSDSVPTHLLTVEAVKGYLTHLKPDGVLVLHVTNRNMDLRGPAMAVAKAAGGVALLQIHYAPRLSPALWESSEDAVIVGKTPQALSAFIGDTRWQASSPTASRPWTDDYVNLVGAIYAHQKESYPWLP